MTKKQQTTIQAITDMLSDNLGTDFGQLLPNDHQFRSSALEAVMEQNRKLIQNHLEEIGQYVKIKLACIEELNRLNSELEVRAALLNQGGERPPVPTETRSPRNHKAI